MDEQFKTTNTTAGESLSWLAELAKLELGEQEMTEMERDMRSIMALMDTVKQVSADEMPRPQGITLAELREDTVEPSLPRDLLLEQHPELPGQTRAETFFTIPKIV